MFVGQCHPAPLLLRLLMQQATIPALDHRVHAPEGVFVETETVLTSQIFRISLLGIDVADLIDW